MGLEWKFQKGGGGLNQKTFRGRGMDIFWNNTLLKFAAMRSFRFYREHTRLLKALLRGRLHSKDGKGKKIILKKGSVPTIFKWSMESLGVLL